MLFSKHDASTALECWERDRRVGVSTLDIHREMIELRGNGHFIEHGEFVLRDNSSTGDSIIRTREITRHQARTG